MCEGKLVAGRGNMPMVGRCSSHTVEPGCLLLIEGRQVIGVPSRKRDVWFQMHLRVDRFSRHAARI